MSSGCFYKNVDGRIFFTNIFDKNHLRFLSIFFFDDGKTGDQLPVVHQEYGGHAAHLTVAQISHSL